MNVGAPEIPTTIDEVMAGEATAIPVPITGGLRENVFGRGILALDKDSSCCGLRPPSPCSLTTAREILGAGS